jgi:L-iditol 2-dehydrogenase
MSSVASDRTMKAAVLSGAERMDIRTRDRPDPDAGEVLVRVEHVGICGSDLHYYSDGRNGANELGTPTIMGHESAGTVVEVGEGVTDRAIGDRVAIEPGVPCGTCPYCEDGTYNLCEGMRFMASPPDDGALVEYVAWPAAYVHPLPAEVTTRAGALCEPLSVAIHAVRRAGIDDGDRVLVTGCGPIGLLVMDAAYAAGASAVLAADVVDEKLALATDRGAAAAIDTRDRRVAEAARSAVDGPGVDVVLECSGAESVIAETPDAVRRGGRIVFVGIPSSPDLPTDVYGLIDDELDVRGTYRFRDTYPRAIELLETGQVDVESLVQFEYPLADVVAAFERAAAPETVKGMIAVDR